jgi:hypothetical protein
VSSGNLSSKPPVSTSTVIAALVVSVVAVVDGGRPSSALVMACGTDNILRPRLLAQTQPAQPITVAERLGNCAQLNGWENTKITKSGWSWNLVSRRLDSSNNRFIEVWRDNGTGLLWGNRLQDAYVFSSAVTKSFSGERVYEEKACDSPEAILNRGGVQDRAFGLPRSSEWVEAHSHGIKEIFSDWIKKNEGLVSWLSSTYSTFLAVDGGSSFPVHYNAAFHSDTGTVGLGFRSASYLVRCVGRPLGTHSPGTLKSQEAGAR